MVIIESGKPQEIARANQQHAMRIRILDIYEEARAIPRHNSMRVLAYVKDMRRPSSTDITMDLMRKAVEAAPRIPKMLSAGEAAAQFFEYTTSGSDDRKPEWL